jgi:hypothetical protein
VVNQYGSNRFRVAGQGAMPYRPAVGRAADRGGCRSSSGLKTTGPPPDPKAEEEVGA